MCSRGQFRPANTVAVAAPGAAAALASGPLAPWADCANDVMHRFRCQLPSKASSRTNRPSVRAQSSSASIPAAAHPPYHQDAAAPSTRASIT